jgi:response regulator RpfG family c-di-GMP phosphodiesterase
MPEMTGMDLYQELTRVAPEETERMVFLTGGAFTPRAQAFLDRMSNPRVEKPIDAQSLLALVDRLLR